MVIVIDYHNPIPQAQTVISFCNISAIYLVIQCQSVLLTSHFPISPQVSKSLIFHTLSTNQTSVMVRSKVKYEFVADDRTRRETFKKRKIGLLKKLKELGTLCDVEACGVIINSEGTQLETWPSPNEASTTIQKFLALPSSSHTNHRVDQVGFLRQNLSRLSKNLDKETQKVHSLEKELFLAESVAREEATVHDPYELHDMIHFLEKKIKMVECRITENETYSSKMDQMFNIVNISAH
ncbi:MADS-box transcription factor family protein [Striga asiatica]|uniref:MADS-box transcription factor family protein n=1 Tax=Striga asiatica TaxID=4170 RepID=A0A5A7QHP8_STRAF|nr:MADS-box transcription factor family protein [Striga asiatica]